MLLFFLAQKTIALVFGGRLTGMVTLNCYFMEKTPQKFFLCVCVCFPHRKITAYGFGLEWHECQNRIYIWVKCSFKHNHRTLDWKLEISFICLFNKCFSCRMTVRMLWNLLQKSKENRKKKETKRGHAAGGSCFNIPTCCCFWICNALWRKEQTVSRAQRRPSKTLWKEHTAMEDNSEPPWPPPISVRQPKVRWYRTSLSTVQSGSSVCVCLNTSYFMI